MQPPFRLPDYSFIYGIAYDAFGFIIYTFPRVVATNGQGIPTQWGFGCATADARHTSVFKDNDSRKRLWAIHALLIAQHHATKLSAVLRKVWIPMELLNCHDMWDEHKLWRS